MTDAAKINAAKREMRREMRASLGALSRQEMLRRSESICNALALGLDDLIESATTGSTSPAAPPAMAEGATTKPNAALFYAPGPDEPDPGPFAALCSSRGMRIAAPMIDWDAGTMLPAAIDALPSPPAPPAPVAADDPPPATAPPPGWLIRRHGVREPDATAPLLPPRALALVLVPGLAFDSSGNRLGRGAGFYDRFLARTDVRHALKIGVAFAGQIRPIVPIMPGDIAMDGVVTEAGFVWVT